MIALLVANTFVAAVTVAFAVVAVVRPAALSRSAAPTGGERFYGWMYAVRAVPLGALAGVLPLAWSGPACAVALLAAAVAQLGDAGIGATRREWGMTAGSSVAAAVHVITAVAVW
ncbi:hypothetical protein [Amycolatopsis sp. CA-230715]|uniref:hypothetical protein n=1 Tax=Amycolatopsis sp. CA-230715 TaxID=2745196 RepID=UPI001C03770F|nr:hypothetical protein [Amycolatopsis sp. CA-230715]QWF84897.1 hypothetical protein HUW46_08349 [Amycolatopsis sp. CA-230715]